ncbi:hypothetical protein Unana1_06236 [Umbelopsis nana]
MNKDKEAYGVKTLESNFPTVKTSFTSKCKQYLRYFFRRKDCLFKFYGSYIGKLYFYISKAAKRHWKKLRIYLLKWGEYDRYGRRKKTKKISQRKCVEQDAARGCQAEEEVRERENSNQLATPTSLVALCAETVNDEVSRNGARQKTTGSTVS